jgi:hypothetical protein
MTSRLEFVRRVLAALPLVSVVLVGHVSAEYRCAAPEQLTNAETRACELAQQDSPGALIRFVNRTKGSYNLYADDYVSQADVERWDRLKHDADEDSPEMAKTRSDSMDALQPE